jgi:hypothetical protein
VNDQLIEQKNYGEIYNRAKRLIEAVKQR